VRSSNDHGRRRRRPPGVNVRPGSVREARLQAGLTLAAVAGPQLTRAAIHLVETGRSRPSRRTLEQIARRTGKPLGFFLPAATASALSGAAATDVADLAALDQFIELGRHSDALDAGRDLLANSGQMPDETRGRVLLRMGQAALEGGDAPQALESLRLARELIRSDDQALRAELLDATGVALHRLEDPGALDSLQHALWLCRAASAVPPHLEPAILGHIGAVHVARHEWDSARALYTEALEAAGNVRDVALLERMHNGLGLAQMGSGDAAAAVPHFQKALVFAEVAAEPRIIARLENNIGSALIEVGSLDAAEEHLRRSLEVCERIGLDVGRGHVLCSLTELALARDDLNEADRWVTAALEQTRRLGEQLTEADALCLAGRLAEARVDPATADRCFAQALSILTSQGAKVRLIECQAQYATLLDARGDVAGALRVALDALGSAGVSATSLLRPHRPAEQDQPTLSVVRHGRRAR